MKNLKRVLALVTVFAMVMSVSAFAHEWSYNEGTQYSNETSGISDILGGIDSDGNSLGTEEVPFTYESVDITMTSDDNSESIVIDGVDADINLNGHEIETGYIDLYEGSLDLSGQGTVEGTIYVNGGSSEYEGKDYNSLTVGEDVTVDSDYAVILYQNEDGHSGYGSTININGTLDGNVWVMGNIKEGDSVININDGAEIAPDIAESDVGVALNGYATVNVNEGAKITADNAIEVRAGTLNVNGGEITSTHTGDLTIIPNGSGTTTNGAGIAVAQHTTKLDIDVNVNGGTITGETAISIANPQNNTGEGAGDIDVDLNGGNIAGNIVIADSETRVDDNFITGGIYNTNVTTYLASGYIQLTSETAVGNLVAGQVVTSAQRQAEIDRLAAEEAARRAAEAASYDDSSDDDTPATPAPVTIEEEAAPLAALPEELAEISTAADVVDTAVELGIIEEDSYVATEAAAAETVVNAVAVIAGDDFGAEEVAAIAEEVGVSFEGEVTRNDLVVVLFTLAEKQGYDVSARASLDAYVDADKASEAMAWAVEVGLINGVDVDKLDPTGTLTQEQLLIIIARFMALTK